MATINDPTVAADIARVGEAARKPLQVTNLAKSGNWYRLSAISGTIAAATAANTALFSFRFLSGTKTFALLHKCKVNAAIVAVGTAIGPVGFEILGVRGWSGAPSGGTLIANSANNMKTETALPNSQVNDIRIATTGAVTLGTSTLDANGQGNILTGILTGAATVQQTAELVSDRILFDADGEGGQPLVLANQEGFIVKTTHVGPAALTYVLGITIVWCEVTAY